MVNKDIHTECRSTVSLQCCRVK